MTKMVRHPRFGDCQLISVDDKTYSIVMYVVLTAQGDEITRPACEFTTNFYK